MTLERAQQQGNANYCVALWKKDWRLLSLETHHRGLNCPLVQRTVHPVKTSHLQGLAGPCPLPCPMF